MLDISAVIDPVTPKEFRRIRASIGWTQKRLAAALGVHPVSVARWEAGTRGIPELAARLVKRIAAEQPKTPKKGGHD